RSERFRFLPSRNWMARAPPQGSTATPRKCSRRARNSEAIQLQGRQLFRSHHVAPTGIPSGVLHGAGAGILRVLDRRAWWALRPFHEGCSRFRSCRVLALTVRGVSGTAGSPSDAPAGARPSSRTRRQQVRVELITDL